MIKIDGKEFDENTLSQRAKQQIVNIQTVDAEIARLNAMLNICQAARVTYSRALLEEVSPAEASPLLENTGNIQFN
jgi:hypothetical protein